VDRLQQVVHHDWENSHPLDLTDEGLLSDLEEHQSEGAEQLALKGRH
jgi:cardiolipin synthase